jgi:DNA adenine methylase
LLGRQAGRADVRHRNDGAGAKPAAHRGVIERRAPAPGRHVHRDLNWADCIERYDRPHTLFYLAPPYWETEGYGVDFPFSEYERMAQLMRGMKGKAIVSLNDHQDIRRCFAGFEMEAVDINYTVGGGQGVARREVIIYSWDRAAEPVGLF